MASESAQQHCKPCAAGTPPLRGEALDHWRSQAAGWEIVDGHHLRRSYKFPDFAQALAFVNKVGALAEAEQHHPDIELGWGRVVVTTYTHSVGGLSPNDFILAAKINALG